MNSPYPPDFGEWSPEERPLLRSRGNRLRQAEEDRARGGRMRGVLPARIFSPDSVHAQQRSFYFPATAVPLRTALHQGFPERDLSLRAASVNHPCRSPNVWLWRLGETSSAFSPPGRCASGIGMARTPRRSSNGALMPRASNSGSRPPTFKDGCSWIAAVTPRLSSQTRPPAGTKIVPPVEYALVEAPVHTASSTSSF